MAGALCVLHPDAAAHTVCIFCAGVCCLKCLRVVFVQPVQGAPYQQAFQCDDCYNEKYTDERGITIIPAEIEHVLRMRIMRGLIGKVKNGALRLFFEYCIQPN